MSDDLVPPLRDLGDRAEYMPHMHHVSADRIEELEAKLAKAVEALETLCQLVDEQCADRLYTQSVVGWEHFADHVGDIARTTLAELKEKTDE